MIYLAADHRGFLRKEELKKYLVEQGNEIVDCGNDHLDHSDDAMDFALKACALIKPDSEDRGIFICGSGVMVDVVANRHSHVRSCLALNGEQIKESRRDDDVNVLCISSDSTSEGEAQLFSSLFLNTEFSSEERFVRRLEKLKLL